MPTAISHLNSIHETSALSKVQMQMDAYQQMIRNKFNKLLRMIFG